MILREFASTAVEPTGRPSRVCTPRLPFRRLRPRAQPAVQPAAALAGHRQRAARLAGGSRVGAAGHALAVLFELALQGPEDPRAECLGGPLALGGRHRLAASGLVPLVPSVNLRGNAALELFVILEA